MNKIGLVVKSNGEVVETGISLQELQAGVDGWIEAVDLAPDLTMYVNEEFLFRSEPDPNPIATAFFSTVGGNYAIHGSVVFTGGVDSEGETMGLSPEYQEIIKGSAKILETSF